MYMRLSLFSWDTDVEVGVPVKVEAQVQFGKDGGLGESRRQQ